MNNYSVSIKNEWEKKLFIYKRNFFLPKDCMNIKRITDHIQKHTLFTKSIGLNNYSVNNKKRRQGCFYSEVFACRNNQITDTISNYFSYCYQLLFPIILKSLYPIVKEIFGDWKIVRATIMYSEPGCPEQEIHHDGNEGSNMWFIIIPLHATPLEQGPTILYEDYKVGKYRNPKHKLTMHNTYNNLGYFKNLNGHKKRDFESARKQFPANLGDFSIHRDITLHSGAANNTSFTRKFLFLTCTNITTKWIDYFDYSKEHGLQLVNSDLFVKNL